MKGLRIRIATGSLSVAALLYNLGCGPQGQNGNQNQYQNANQNQNESVAAALPADLPDDLFKGTDEEACQVSDLKQRADAVRDRILIKIRDDNELWEMYKQHSDPNIGRVLDYTVKDKKGSRPGDIDHLEARFVGQVNRNDQFNDLINKLDDFLRQGCVHKISFFTKPGGPTVTTAGRGFEWTYCEYPKQACDNGECKETCGSRLEGNANNANSNSNRNGSFNSNGSNGNN